MPHAESFHPMTMTTTLQDCRTLDAQDPLRELRQQFSLPDGVIYLDGNSLGVLPASAADRVAKAVTQEWGQGLIRSWNSAGWFNMPQRLARWWRPTARPSICSKCCQPR